MDRPKEIVQMGRAILASLKFAGRRKLWVRMDKKYRISITGRRVLFALALLFPCCGIARGRVVVFRVGNTGLRVFALDGMGRKTECVCN